LRLLSFMRCRRGLALLAVRAVVLEPWLGYPPFRPAIVCKPHRSLFRPGCPCFVIAALDLRFCRGGRPPYAATLGPCYRHSPGWRIARTPLFLYMRQLHFDKATI